MNKKDYKNFCILPFISIYGKFTLKDYRPCCEWEGGFDKDYDTIEHLWNGEEIQQVREMFNNRQMPKQCYICMSDEKLGLWSKRQFHNEQYPDETDYFYNNPQTIAPMPVYWDMRPSNICNLECVMCDTKNSSNISDRVDTYYKSFQLDGDRPFGKIYGLKQENSYFEYMKLNADNIKEILFAGGEPFLMPEVLHLLEWLNEHNYAKNIRLRILTNGTVFRSKWMDMLKGFKELKLLISLDGVEEVVEYARFPNKWPGLEKNVLKFNELNKEAHCKVILNPCIHIMNFVGLHRLLDFAKTHNLVITPSLVYRTQGDYDYLQISRIKPEIFKEELEKCYAVLSDWKNGNESVKFLNSIKDTEFSMGKYYKDFQTYIEYLDSHRPVKFIEQYPYFDYLLQNKG